MISNFQVNRTKNVPNTIVIAPIIFFAVTFSSVNIPQITKVKNISLCSKMVVFIPEVLLLPMNINTAGIIMINTVIAMAYFRALKSINFLSSFLKIIYTKRAIPAAKVLNPANKIGGIIFVEYAISIGNRA
ncbi:MAG: hypothetical protein WC651_02960 [Candidatus Gracilibacteria bacterium]